MPKPPPDTSMLEPQQYRALVQLAAGNTNSAVAKSLNISIKTIEHWRKSPQFKQLLREALGQCFDAAMAELVQHSQEAVKELNRIALDPSVPARVRVSAIGTMLTFAAKTKESHLESRLEALERQLENGFIDIQAEEIREDFAEAKNIKE